MEPDPLGTRAAQHGQELPGPRPVAQRGRQLLGGQLHALEVPLEQVVVGLRDGLDQPLARRRHLVRQLRRRRLLLHDPRVALVDEGSPGEDVHDAVEPGLGPDRHLKHRRLGAEQLQVLERVVHAGALAVEPGDEADGRQAALLAPGPHLLGLDLDLAAGRAQHQHHAGRRHEAVVGVVQERRVSWRVDQTQLVLLPGDVMERRGDRGLAALLLGLGVERGRAVVDAADARGRAGGEQHGVGDAGLARAALPDDGDVA
jgi:hypothetical protein